MSKRPGKPAVGKRAVSNRLTYDEGTVTGPADLDCTTVALCIDGRFACFAPARDGRFTTILPSAILGTTLTAIDPRTNRHVAEPLDLTGFRHTAVEALFLEDLQIKGRFQADGIAPAGEPIPIELIIDDTATPVHFALPVADRPGHYAFTAPLPALPPLNEPARVALRIGGQAQTGTDLTISAQSCGYAGYLDHAEGGVMHGWAVDLANPRRRLRVDLRVDGVAVAHTIANRARQDLVDLGIGDGKAGFVVALPRGTPRDRDVEISVVVDGTDVNLSHSPFIRPASPPFMGFFDAVEGPFAGGWVVNMHAPETPLVVEALCDNEVIGSGLANLYRGDVQNAGMPTARCGFRILLERPISQLIDRDIVMRIKDTTDEVQGSPRRVMLNTNIGRFLTRSALTPSASLQRLARLMTYRTRDIGLSIIMPVFNTRKEWLIEALNSVLQQWSANWELICIDDGSTEPHVREVLDAAARMDPRVRVLRSAGNAGIARAINFGLRAARGTYVAFMDHDDVIEPDAVYHLARAAKETGAELIYSDEAITTEDINSVIEVRARPAFSWDFYMSHPYFVHLIAVRADTARAVAGWDETMPISADVDFVLRVVERARRVAHVPRVLYRWRTHSSSTGHSKQDQVTAVMVDSLQRHLGRLACPATAKAGLRFNEYRIDWPDDGGEVLIVIPTKDRVDLLKTCIDSIEETSDGANYRIVVIDHQSSDRKTLAYLEKISARHTIMPYAGIFNYAKMNNLAVKTHLGQAKYVLFLNNDVEAIAPGWIPRLRSLAARPEVGAVGPLLLYGDDRVQHAGVLVGFSGAADHAMKFANAYLSKGSRHPGYNCNLTSVRDYSAVTAACVMIPADVFRRVDGFDEQFVIGFNDTDLCLRIGDAGFKVLYDGTTLLYHHESATRTESKTVDHPEDDRRLRKRWRRFFTDGDPFYSPLLAPKGTDHTLRTDEGCKSRMRVRVVQNPGRTANKPVRRSGAKASPALTTS